MSFSTDYFQNYWMSRKATSNIIMCPNYYLVFVVYKPQVDIITSSTMDADPLFFENDVSKED